MTDTTQDCSATSMCVGDFAQTNLLTCTPDTPLAHAAALMRQQGRGSVLVVDATGQPVGIWTESDAARLDFADPAAFDVPIATVMSGPLTTIAATSDAGAAVLRLREAHIRHLLVVDASGAAIGMVTQTDLALRYGLNHFLRLRAVGEVVADGLLRLPGALSAAEAARRMAEVGHDAAIVECQDGTLGIVTEHDLLGLVAQRQTGVVLCEMASIPLRCVAATSALLDARRLLIDEHIRHLGVTDATGAVIGLLSLRDMLDLLERTYAANLADTLRQRDEELLRSHHDLTVARQVINSSEDGVMLIGRDGRIESVNPAFCRQTGYTAEESIGHAPDELLNCEEEIPGFCARLCTQVGQLGHWRGVLWCRRRDGVLRAWSMQVHAITADGQATGLYAAVFFDVTETTLTERTLREERDLIAAGPSVVFKWAPTTGWPVTYVSDNVANVFGHRPEDLLAGRPAFPDLIHPDDLARVTNEVTKHLAAGDALFHQHYRFHHADGRWRWIDDYTRVVVDATGHPVSIHGYVIDVTEKAEADEKLRLAASVFLHAREGIMITDAQGNIAEVNATFNHITGYSRAEVIGRNPNLLSSGRQGPAFYAALWQALTEAGHWSGEVWNQRKNGEVYAEFITISAVRDSEDRIQHYVALFSDITPQKEYQQQLEHIAHYDTLTGLPNRLLLADRMRQALARSHRGNEILAVCVMDLDGFKPINDTFGHKAGDSLLQEIARRLQEGIRAEDTAARIGGDEFVLLLTGFKSGRDCEELLRRLLANIAQPVFIEGQSMRVSASIGLTLYPSDRTDADQLLRHADQAMYKAKALGKNRYHFFHLLAESRIQANLGLIGRMEAALDQNQFVLHYQPKVDCRSGRVIGFEALVRWNHPVLGLRLPGEFLPLIEHEEIIERLGEWVLTTVLGQMQSWRRERPDLDFGVSVNLAARQLARGDPEHRLADLIARFPAEIAHRLTLEVLESAALEDIDAVRGLMARLQPLGVSFSLDDFGTGYSSLAHLKQLPVDELKIDRAFVQDMLDDAGDLAIVEGVVGLAQAFDRRLVAEGVENIEQILMLLEQGCDVMQGFVIARPLPAEHVMTWLDTFHADPRWSAANLDYPVREDFDLLLMEVSHHHWLGQLKHAVLHGKPPPDIERSRCRLTDWLDNRGARRFQLDPAYPDLVRLHQHVHALARTLVDNPVPNDNGDTTDTTLQSKQLDALEQSHAALLLRLRQLRATLSRIPLLKET